jgi:hypothetical protein
MARHLAALLLALALALAGCAAPTGAGPATMDPARPTPPEPTEVPTPPPATPRIPAGVTPTTSEVVVRVLAVPDVTGPGPMVPVTVYADGSVVVPAVIRFDGPGVRRLTPAGLERLVARLRASGLFETSRTIPPLRPPESGFVTYTVELHDAGRVVSVDTINAFASADGRRLIDLAEAILMHDTPAEPLDPGDWVDGSAALLPYRAESTRLTAETVPFPPGTWARPPVEVGGLAWPLPGTPLTIGEPLAAADDPARTIRCAIVSGADEARLRAALDTARIDSAETASLTRSWDLSAPSVPGLLRLSLRPFLPEETPACDAAGLPGAPEPQLPPEPGFAEAWAAARLDASKRPALLQVLVETFPETDVPARAVPVASVHWPRDAALEEPSCEVVPFADADTVVRALEVAGAAETGGSPDIGEYELAGSAPDSLVRVSVRVVGLDELDPCGANGF